MGNDKKVYRIVESRIPNFEFGYIVIFEQKLHFSVDPKGIVIEPAKEPVSWVLDRKLFESGRGVQILAEAVE